MANYIGFIRKECDNKFHVTYPEFPELSLTAGTLDEALDTGTEALQRRVGFMIEREEVLPSSSGLDAVVTDPARAVGMPFLISVEEPSKAVRVNVILEEELLTLIADASLNRSRFISAAAWEKLERDRLISGEHTKERGITEANAARNFFAAGKGYAIAAKAVTDSPEYDPRQGTLVLPLSMLIAQSIESYLKSFLSLKGISNKSLAYSYGHDLKKLARDCYLRGMGDCPQLDTLVAIFADGHSKTTNYAFRYLQEDFEYKLFNRENLGKALHQLAHEMDVEINPKNFK